jgi:hypothetical protein
MVSVLPYVPSFGEKLASSFGTAAGTAASGYFQGRREKQNSDIINKFENAALGIDTSSPVDQVENAAKNSVHSASDFGRYLKAYEAKYGKEAASIVGKQYADEQKSIRETKEKEALDKKERAKSYKKFSTILGDLEKNKEYAGRIIFGPLNRTAVKKKSEIDSEAIALEGFFRDQNTKGALSAKVFEELLNRIPHSKDSEAEYQGKIDGIKGIIEAEFGNADDFIEGIKPQKEKPPLESFLK